MTDASKLDRARRTLGQQLALLRKAAGYSQHEFAPLTHYGRSTVANVEVGRQNVPRTFWETCDRILRTNGLLAVGHDQIQRLEVRERIDAARTLSVARPLSVTYSSSPEEEPGGLSSSRPQEMAEEDVQFSSLLMALTIERSPTIMSENARLDVGGPIETSPDEAAALILQRFLRLDAEQGGDQLYGPMSQIVANMAPAVEDSGVGLSAFGQLAQMTGWLALDSNRHGAARRYLNMTVYAAHEADEPALAASALAYMSLQDTYRGRSKSALSLARTAYETSNGAVSRLTRTMLATRLARAHAVMGNKRHSLAALDVARQAFSFPANDVDPLWVSYVDEIELSAQEGACYLELRMPTEAIRALKHALRLQQCSAPYRVRDQVHYLSRVAKCELLNYDVEAACHTAREALRLAGDLGSPRVAERLHEFRDALQPYAKNKIAQEFCAVFSETIHGTQEQTESSAKALARLEDDSA
jgi:tetratricopeptide (TPR) repeat protein/DNA-binding XRE family transcriptional regulator